MKQGFSSEIQIYQTIWWLLVAILLVTISLVAVVDYFISDYW
jgi:hypothetical protein